MRQPRAGRTHAHGRGIGVRREHGGEGTVEAVVVAQPAMQDIVSAKKAHIACVRRVRGCGSCGCERVLWQGKGRVATFGARGETPYEEGRELGMCSTRVPPISHECVGSGDMTYESCGRS